jgi:hypothetical protein
MCRAENWRLGIWNCDSGVQFPIEQTAIPGVTETQDPLAVVRALPQVSQGAGTAVLLFENLHRFLGSVELIQAVARQAISGKHNRAFIVVLAPVTQIPSELDKLFVCVDHELPDHAQLEEIARGVATQDGELPSGDELPRVIDAAKGLTRSEAENAYSLSLVRHGTLKRFRRLNIRSSPELDMLVEEAQQVITGIEPQQLRDSVRLRQMVARDFEQIQASVGEMLVDRPRRNILRRGHVGGAVWPVRWSWSRMLGVTFDVCMAKSWTCGNSGSCRSPERVMSSQIGTASGGLIWGLLMGLYWGPTGAGRRRWGWREGG